MLFKSKIHLRRRLLLASAAGLVIVACAMAYLVFLFLSFDSMPLADGVVTGIVNRLLQGQMLNEMDLELEVDPVRSRLKGRARITCELPQRPSHPLLRHLLFYVPTDLVLFLHPDLAITRMVWGDRELKHERIKTMVFVDLGSEVPLDGIVILDLSYEGTLSAGRGGSLVAPDLVYLDPEDNYYPSQGGEPCRLKVNLKLPKGLNPVVPDTEGLVSAFALAASPHEPVEKQIGKMVCRFYGWAGGETAWMDLIEEVSLFFDDRGLGDDPRTLRIIKSPRQLEATVRYDEAGTLLLPGEASEGDLAFLTALYRVKSFMNDENSLFSCEELAKGLSLYFLQRRRGDGMYRKELLKISSGDAAMPLPFRSATRFGLAKRRGYGLDPGGGAYYLAMFRRLVGDDAFDRILDRILAVGHDDAEQGWETWHEAAHRYTGENLRWLLKDWVRKRGTFDLDIADFSVEEHAIGQTVRLQIRNRGNLDLPEKVKVLIITETGVVRQSLPITGSRNETTCYVPEPVIGVVVDPDLEWFDVDRTNNMAYLAPPPYLVMPSEDNLHLAVAYYKRVEARAYPLVVFRASGEDVQAFFLKYPVQKVEWINGHRLLVHTKACGAWSPFSFHYLVDIHLGKVESFPSSMEISPSDSGRYLLINEKEGPLWRHRLKDLEKNLTRTLLASVPYHLEWLPGTDLITPIYPYGHAEDVEIFSTAGERKYRFSKADAHLFAFQGYEGGLAFLREKDGVYSFYTLAAPLAEPKRLAILEDETLDFVLSRFGGTVYLKQTPAVDQIKISRLDPASEKKSVLFVGFSEGLYDLFSDKGVLMKKKHSTEEGRIYQDIQFHRFSEEQGRFITHSLPPERVLALAGNQRYLYYAEEIQMYWSTLPSYNQYRFFRYDFLSREVSGLDFSAWSP